MQRVGLIRVKIVNATKTLAAILSGQWLRRLGLLSLAPPLMAVVSIGQETGYHGKPAPVRQDGHLRQAGI